MKSCLTKFKSFQRKSVQIEALQKYIANFYTSPYKFVACLPNPYNPAILSWIWRVTILPFSSSK